MAECVEDQRVPAEENPLIAEQPSGGGRVSGRMQAYLVKGAALLAALMACTGAGSLVRHAAGARGAPASTSGTSLAGWLQGKSAEVHSLNLTSGTYTDADDHAEACRGEFGQGSRVADWDMDLAVLKESEIDSLMHKLHINTTLNTNNYFVTQAGRQYWIGPRAYFFHTVNPSPPGGWDSWRGKHGNITLRSWFAVSGPVLCATGLAHPDAGVRAPGAPCGRISAKRVFDVQWSGDQSRTTQTVSGLAEPYYPGKGHLSVDREHDYFGLSRNDDGSYSLRQYGPDGTLKAKLPDGNVTLASTEMVFYIIRGWFGTIITSQEDPDPPATFTGLTYLPSEGLVTQSCTAPQEADCATVCRGKHSSADADCASTLDSCTKRCGAADLSCDINCTSAKLECSQHADSSYNECALGCVLPSAASHPA